MNDFKDLWNSLSKGTKIFIIIVAVIIVTLIIVGFIFPEVFWGVAVIGVIFLILGFLMYGLGRSAGKDGAGAGTFMFGNILLILGIGMTIVGFMFALIVG